MNADFERSTQEWLDAQTTANVGTNLGPDEFVFDDDAHPIRLSRFDFETLQRKLAIFRWLDRLRFTSFLDVGSGSDYYPYLARSRYGAESYYSDMLHRVNRPFDDRRYGKLDHAVTLNVTRLPFRDESFDVVLASEVLEHLVRPVEAIAELLRITRKCLVMTSLEALSANRLQRLLSDLRIDTRQPHVERNFFLLDELAALFGPGFHHQCLFDSATAPASHFETPERQEAAFASLRGRGELVDALCRAVSSRAHGPGTMGILLLKTKGGSTIDAPDRAGDAALAEWLVREAAARERAGWFGLAIWEVMRQRPELRPADLMPEHPVADSLLPLLQGPDCRGELERGAPALRCRACGAAFASEYGVPILYPSNPTPQDAAEEILSRLCGTDRRRRAIVRRLMHKLRRQEGPPGIVRRALWQLLPPA
jgi:SAM-dependent methyltransferase